MARECLPSRSTRRKNKLMKLGEKGFTLIEIVVVLAIMAIIMAPLSMSVMTLLTNPQRSNEKNIVLQQVRNAGDWISRDVQMAENVTASGPDGFPLSLRIPVDADENNDYRIEYLFDDIDDSKLKRQVYDSSENLISETLIADYIATDNTTFVTENVTAGHHKLTVKAVRDGTAITAHYEVNQRLSAE